MKKYIASFLIPCLLLQLAGCYSFQQISINEELEMINSEDKDVKITLTNGDIIQSEAFHHTFIMKPTEFIISKGDKFFQDKELSKTFNGKIFLSEIDSSFFNENKRIYTVWLKSKDKVNFPEGDYFIATEQTENGFWYWNKNQTSRIDLSDIAMFEVDELNVVATLLLVGGGIIAVIFVYFLATFDMNLSLWDGNGSW